MRSHPDQFRTHFKHIMLFEGCQCKSQMAPIKVPISMGISLLMEVRSP